ncbi:MaoC/PaaZ C-terminal domain-containing protein [Mycobacterium sp. SMC-19]|uniref:MaoC/PaaZ C-terminal domain-containing protein n=1 Tax=Mycobacterium sp. SMC-19 TaxID=3381630 RepID=UPI003875F0DB
MILYHLGIGAGAATTDPAELKYVYEEGLRVLPSFGVIPAFSMLQDMLRLSGMDVELSQIPHGEQDLHLHDVLPANGDVRTSANVCEVSDKGKAALVVLETVTRYARSDKPLVTNRFSAFIRGEGGFDDADGRRPPAAAPPEPPDRVPDVVVDCPTLPQQALLYRLSGDMNPIHVDPEFARRGGFDRPILHGLCSYGMVCKAVVDNVLGGEVERGARYRARFAGVVFPGEVITVRMWREKAAVLFEALSKERGSVVLSNASIELR